MARRFKFRNEFEICLQKIEENSDIEDACSYAYSILEPIIRSMTAEDDYINTNRYFAHLMLFLAWRKKEGENSMLYNSNSSKRCLETRIYLYLVAKLGLENQQAEILYTLPPRISLKIIACVLEHEPHQWPHLKNICANLGVLIDQKDTASEQLINWLKDSNALILEHKLDTEIDSSISLRKKDLFSETDAHNTSMRRVSKSNNVFASLPLLFELNEEESFDYTDITQRERVFMTICQMIYENLPFSLQWTLEHHKSLLSAGCMSRNKSWSPSKWLRWVFECVIREEVGFATLLKVLVQFFDLFVGSSYCTSIKEERVMEQIARSVVSEGLYCEYYKSIWRIKLITNLELAEHKEGFKYATLLLLKIFRNIPSIEDRNRFRDWTFHNRQGSLQIDEPTFGAFDIWPFDFNRTLITASNQFVAESKNEEKEDIPYTEITQPAQDSVVDTLIELSLISPFQVLLHLVQSAIHNKGQAVFIVSVLRRMGRLCWLRPTTTCHSLLIEVIRSILQDVDEGDTVWKEEVEIVNFISLLKQCSIAMNNTASCNLDDGSVGELFSENLFDIRELLEYCILPFLRPATLDVPGREITLIACLHILNIFIESTLKSPIEESIQCWLSNVQSIELIYHLSLLYNLRARNAIDLKILDLVEQALSATMSIGMGWIKNSEYNTISDSLLYLAVERFYDKLNDLDWSTQMLLCPLLHECSNKFGFLVPQIRVPAQLIEFCGSDEGLTPISEPLVDSKGSKLLMRQLQQLFAFIEGCSISEGWCFRLVQNLAQEQHIAYIRPIFSTYAPLAFCRVLTTRVSNEYWRLLVILVRELINRGILSVVDLTSNVSSVFEDIDLEGRIRLAIVSFAIKVLCSFCILRKLEPSLQKAEGTVVHQLTRVLEILWNAWVENSEASPIFTSIIFRNVCLGCRSIFDEQSIERLYILIFNIVHNIPPACKRGEIEEELVRKGVDSLPKTHKREAVEKALF
ncbi:uncharacterized protein VTP21DRAFT_365 [Calcarisporiella thermophila]|uniref:uncharacterized protein n=1 Tax=Calcarisporiella thermophila TaxID=911321 RepID=UPI0037437B63